MHIGDDEWPSLEEALEAERKITASLSSKLKKSRARNKKLRTTSNIGFPRSQSTMREVTRVQGNESLSISMNNLSFASLNIAECTPMDGEDDIDKKSFENWKDLLEASMKLIRVTDEDTKMSIFKIKAGQKLLDILEGTVSSTSTPCCESAPYSNAMNRLKDFFGSRDYCLLQRQKLRSLTQNVNEPDSKYVRRVINTAKLCDFSGDQLGENVADVIQTHALSLRIREIGRKMLRKGGSIPELLEKIRAFEIGQLNEKLFAKSHPAKRAEVDAVSVDYQPDSSSGRYTNQRTFTA
ncbi:uncharacterized protein LOC135707763 [Ochlerotatus camptorhynchus]|uniref:uncharacterized protein LOC135707763 n=1 Tax=Ochlerotatus camptorhynchus TaxID=644619 RepID=UPI0031D3234B